LIAIEGGIEEIAISGLELVSTIKTRKTLIGMTQFESAPDWMTLDNPGRLAVFQETRMVIAFRTGWTGWTGLSFFRKWEVYRQRAVAARSYAVHACNGRWPGLVRVCRKKCRYGMGLQVSRQGNRLFMGIF
jgi:hypothetical protein